MAILTGRNGSVKYDPLGVTPVALIALNTWKLSLKTDFEDVSCFGDTNKVYIPGMRDISGSIGGFWDSTNVALFTATAVDTPGRLELAPNKTEATAIFGGKAFIDADIDCSLGAPKVSSSFRAAGPWTLPPATGS
jgi:hypothetical protein